jgi:hypothetical protein
MESSMSKAGLDNRHRNKDGEIRQQPGCHNVEDIGINRMTDDRAEAGLVE